MQTFKQHPWLHEILAGGKLLKYGAALLPEGGFDSLPERFAVDGALLLGDALGVLDIATLAGIDKAMECGWQAASVLYDELVRQGDFRVQSLAPYQQAVMSSHVGRDLKQNRYFRLAWQENPRLLKHYLPGVVSRD